MFQFVEDHSKFEAKLYLIQTFATFIIKISSYLLTFLSQFSFAYNFPHKSNRNEEKDKIRSHFYSVKIKLKKKKN